MVSNFGRRLLAGPLAYITKWLLRLGVTPNMLTYTGFGLAVFVAVVLGTGQLFWGGLLMVIAALFDTLDGALARETNQTSTFGAFIDSTLDRYSESVTLLGLAYYLSGHVEFRVELILVFVTIVGSLMVSYTRARAEALNIDCKVGILQRPERIILLAVGLLTAGIAPILLTIVLWVLAIMTNVTTAQRIHAVYVSSGQPASTAAKS